MCTTCTTDKGFEHYGDAVRDRVDSMMIQDWLTLGLASLVVAFAVFAEMRDALLCSMALQDISQKREVPRGWRFAIRGLNFARYYIMLPNVIVSVVTLVLSDGGRVKDVCLNTVAVLFLLEVDNLAFVHGLGERTRMEAEEHSGAHEHVTEHDLETMDAVKLVCVLTIPCAIVGGVCGAYARNLADGETDNICFMLAPLPSMLVVFVQRVKANGRRGACAGLGWAVAGFIVFWLWWFAVLTLMVYQAQGAGALDGG